MKILHIIEDYSLKSGGLRTVVKNLDFYLNSIGIESHIISSAKEPEDDIKVIKSNNVWLYNKEWKKEIIRCLAKDKIDLIHIHGVWTYPQYIAAKISFQKQIPFILTPHGMYEPWLWNKGGFKKRTYFKLLGHNALSKAKFIHGITNDEVVNLKALFNNNKFKEIPNLISVKDNFNEVSIESKYILYLGRLDSKKGIDLLLKAFSKIQNSNFILKIAGGINDYKEILDKHIIELNISDRVEFLGMIKNKEKEDVIKKAWVLVAPSFSEVIGMVNLEAAAFKTPVITTYQTGIKKEWNNHGGFLINPNVDELYNVLKKALKWTKEERNINGKKLFSFVEQEYSWERKLSSWEEFYNETINS